MPSDHRKIQAALAEFITALAKAEEAGCWLSSEDRKGLVRQITDSHDISITDLQAAYYARQVATNAVPDPGESEEAFGMVPKAMLEAACKEDGIYTYSATFEVYDGEVTDWVSYSLKKEVQ